MLWLIVAGGILVDLLAALGDRASCRINLGEWGTTPIVAAVLTVVLVAAFQPPAAPARGGPAGVLRARLAALRRQARRGAAQLLRRLSRADLERRRLSHPRARHDAARRAAHAETRRASRSTIRRPPPTTTRTARSRRPSPRCASGSGEQKGRYGVTGLGAGSLACHCQGGRGVALLRDRSGGGRHRQATRATSRS